MIYKSKRVGKEGKEFYLYKLRTMRVDGGSPTASEDDPRLTKAGRWLRKYKLDEIPTLWNVLKGDMSLVGPRPEVPEVINMMTEDEKRVILSVRPGITDLASLENYNEDERLKGKENPHEYYLKEIWPEKKRLQIEYIKNKSLQLDIYIIIKTLWKLITRPKR